MSGDSHQRRGKTRALILSGGVAHPFGETSPALARIFATLGIASDWSSDVETALLAPAPTELMVFNLFRDTHFSASYPADVVDPAYSPSPTARAAILNHIREGGGLLAVHGAVISFSDWPEWAQILGAGWVPGKSGHPKRGAMEMRVRADFHPITHGIDSYWLDDDEAYGFLDLAEDNLSLAYSAHGDADHPMLWLREYGGGRVAYLAPCHGSPTLSHPVHQALIRRTVLWLLGREEEIPLVRPSA